MAIDTKEEVFLRTEKLTAIAEMTYEGWDKMIIILMKQAFTRGWDARIKYNRKRKRKKRFQRRS